MNPQGLRLTKYQSYISLIVRGVPTSYSRKEKKFTSDVLCLAFPNLAEAAFTQDTDDVQTMTRNFPTVFRLVLVSLIAYNMAMKNKVRDSRLR